MNYKSIKDSEEYSNKKTNIDEDYLALEILEDLLNFNSDIFCILIKTFTTCFKVGNFVKCKLILTKRIIPFFQSSRPIFDQNYFDTTFFINTFQKNNIFDQYLQIIQENNEFLINQTVLLLSILSSLDESFCKYIVSFPNLLDSLILYMNECKSTSLENIAILYNNSLQYIDSEMAFKFIDEFIEEVQETELDIIITINIFINFIRFFDLTISNYPYIINIIIEGISKSFYKDSLNLLYYCYQKKINRDFLFSNLNKLIEIIISTPFSNIECLRLYFKILLDFMKYDDDNEYRIREMIFYNFPIQTLQNIIETRDPQLIQYLFSFLLLSPQDLVIKFSNEYFTEKETFFDFIIQCFMDGELKLKRSALAFLTFYLKIMKSDFFNFLIDDNFIHTLIDFLESNEIECKLVLQFLNTITESNFITQSYSSLLFQSIQDDDVIDIINELATSSEDSEIVSLAENILNYYDYEINAPEYNLIGGRAVVSGK